MNSITGGLLTLATLSLAAVSQIPDSDGPPFVAPSKADLTEVREQIGREIEGLESLQSKDSGTISEIEKRLAVLQTKIDAYGSTKPECYVVVKNDTGRTQYIYVNEARYSISPLGRKRIPVQPGSVSTSLEGATAIEWLVGAPSYENEKSLRIVDRYATNRLDPSPLEELPMPLEWTPSWFPWETVPVPQPTPWYRVLN